MDAKTRQEIEKKAELYEAAKNRIKERIEENVKIAIEKLKDAERELLDEVDAEFGENPFAKFLGGEGHTEDDMKEILKRVIHHGFGPDDDSFKSLHREIESLREWRKKLKPEQLIPKNVSVKEARLDSISVSWDAVEGASSYLVEVDGDEVFWRPGASSTFTKGGLLPDTEHSFRVRTIHERVMGEWSDVVKGKTKKLPAPSNVKAKSESWDSITLTWDDDMTASFYQIEVDGSRSLERAFASTFTKKKLLLDTEHTFRVRAVRGNSVSEWSNTVKEKVKLPTPFNITTYDITWDSISLAWDVVEGALSYQIEVDESRSWDASTTNTFTKTGLLADTGYTFRVRAVRGNSASEWSNAVKGKTQKEITPYGGAWKECPDNAYEWRKYSVNKRNPRIVAKKDCWDGYITCDCTIIGNTPLPLNQVTSWSIKILKSKDNDGGSIYIGVAPSDINQNNDNFNSCGWYFNCYDSSLCSGPPHNYKGKDYGPRKGSGQYVHVGDSIGVVMNTAKDKISFSLNGVNLGVAYEGIPLDKPLVPCVLLYYAHDSVELVI